VFDRIRDEKVAVNPRKTELGLEEVEYVDHLASATDTSFTQEERLKVLDFPQPTIQKAIHRTDNRHFILETEHMNWPILTSH
jgi:hypothetical protein